MKDLFQRIKPLSIFPIVLALSLGSALSIRPVTANSIVVNNVADLVANDGLCTLREAIISANTDTPSGSASGECPAGSGADIISLAAGIYTLTTANLRILSEITILGETAETTIIQASTCNPVDPGEICTHDWQVFSVDYSDSYQGHLTLNGVTLRHGNPGGSGGAVFVDGSIEGYASLHLINSIITANQARFRGGGIANFGNLIITNSTLAQNKAEGVDRGEGGAISNYQDVSISDSNIIGNNSYYDGGGLYNTDGGHVTVSNSTFAENESARNGGGIYNKEGTLTVTESEFSRNKTTSDGGGIYNTSLGTVEITSSTFSENEASIFAGGFYNEGILSITNSTLSGNYALAVGGIFNSGTLTLTSSTLSGNFALMVNKIGGIFNLGGTLEYANTIIANSGDDVGCTNEENGIILSNTYNLVEDGSCVGGAIGFVTGDPKLGDLDDNGGPTLTHALLPGSPAIDAGDPAYCPGSDQRGVARPQGTGCDIGAFEFVVFVYLPLIIK
jgi:CSLREA domain-containing protein